MQIDHKNVYLADDDIDDQEFFQEALAEICHNCTLTIFPNGARLIKNLEEPNSNPGIIFIDINMPIMNGLEVLKYIKDSGVHKTVPLIVYSTSSNAETINSAKMNGANFYLVKPADFGMLKERINKLLEYDWHGWQMPEEFKKFVL